MPPIINLADPSDWTEIYNITLYAQSASPVTNAFNPIPVHNIPVRPTRRTLTIGSSSFQIKPTWRLGFYLIAAVQVPGIGRADVLNVPIHMGLNLVRLPNLNDEFFLRARIPRWHREMNIVVWQYNGTETDN